MAETLFLLFSTRRPRPKRIFCHFLHFGRGRKPIFNVFRSSAVDDERFFMKIDDLPPYLSSFFWKPAIYYRIWIVFSENRQFTIVSEQIFLKIVNLLSYLNSFFWKLMIYYRIWTDFSENRWFTPVSEWFFSENWWFTPVSEWFFLKIDNLLPYLGYFP